MAITYEQAVEKLHEWTDSTALLNHARGVEAAMRRAAHRYGAGAADEPRWAIAGLLHDADYDRWPEEHPRRVVAWLKEQGEPEIAQAVVAHFHPADVAELTTLDKALLACDELTGFVMACCLRPPGRDPFAGACERQEKTQGQELRRQGQPRRCLQGRRAVGRQSRRTHSARHRRTLTPCRGTGLGRYPKTMMAASCRSRLRPAIPRMPDRGTEPPPTKSDPEIRACGDLFRKARSQ